jgi:murein L,D-transpeptidase YcbB/YkuD
VPDSALDREWSRREADPPPERRLAEALAHHAVAESLAASAPADTAYRELRAALAREVREVQERHGLAATGIADAATRAIMDTAFARRVRTVEANLERRRWLPPRPGPRVEVNIADETLEAFADTGLILRMKVVVGDRTHPTPVFSTAIAWMDLHPTWTMTRRVVAEEILPELRRDPAYLEKHQLLVLRPIDGVLTQISPSAVNWDSVTSDTFRTFVRQADGPLNPLGRIRFMCPNRFDVFLHDTNQRGLFRRADRAKSHGCVRLERPLELASWLLSRTVPTPVDSIRVALRDTTERRWPLDPRVPLDVLYWTAWVDDQGTLQVRDDLYGLDARLMDAIEHGRPESFVLNPETEWGIERAP